MFCSSCGTESREGERFCSKCGQPLKNGGKSDKIHDKYEPIVVNLTPEKAAEMIQQSSKTKKSSKRKKGGVVVIILLMLIVLLVGVGLLSNALNANSPEEIFAALLEKEEDSGFVSASDAADNEETTTTTLVTTTTTTTTTAKPTTTTTSKEDLLAEQAEEIKALLVSKKWKTQVQGYDAVITFYENGTALIEVDVKLGFFSVTQKVDATFEVTPKCFASIKGTYNGMNLAIAGDISKISDNELRLDCGSSFGIVTLEAK